MEQWDKNEVAMERYTTNLLAVSTFLQSTSDEEIKGSRAVAKKLYGLLQPLIEAHKHPDIHPPESSVAVIEWYNMILEWVLDYNAAKEALLQEYLEYEVESFLRALQRKTSVNTTHVARQEG